MIFVDSNIPMYLVGAEHPLKHAAHFKRYGVRRILSFDKGFDRLGFVTRIPAP